MTKEDISSGAKKAGAIIGIGLLVFSAGVAWGMGKQAQSDVGSRVATLERKVEAYEEMRGDIKVMKAMLEQHLAEHRKDSK